MKIHIYASEHDHSSVCKHDLVVLTHDGYFVNLITSDLPKLQIICICAFVDEGKGGIICLCDPFKISI